MTTQDKFGSNSVLCSHHFPPQAFTLDSNGRRNLDPGVIPSIFPQQSHLGQAKTVQPNSFNVQEKMKLKDVLELNDDSIMDLDEDQKKNCLMFLIKKFKAESNHKKSLLTMNSVLRKKYKDMKEVAMALKKEDLLSTEIKALFKVILLLTLLEIGRVNHTKKS